MTDESAAPVTVTKADEQARCDHLVVLDTFHLLTGQARTVAGDCYCVRCCKPVPYWLNGGAVTAVR